MSEKPNQEPVLETPSTGGKNGRSEDYAYDFPPIDLESDSVHADVVRLVGEGARVLELGPATGYMTQAMRARGCSIVGIEIDPAMAKKSEAFCERIIIGDLDVLDLGAELEGEKFDVVVAADVLEHLKDPLGALRRLSRFLAEDGAFVISVPNVAHGSVRLALMGGNFDYQSVGLLDRTHLRFFTRETLGELLDEAELGVAVLHRHELNIDASEIPFDPNVVPRDVVAKLDAEPDARTYQFVVKAFPMDRPGLRELQRRLRELTLECTDAKKEAEALRDVNKQLLEVSAREGQLRSSLIEAHDQLLRRDAEIERLGRAYDDQIQALRGALAGREEELRLLQLRLDRIMSIPPYSLYSAFRNFPGVRKLAARRKASFEKAAQDTSDS